MYHIVIATLFTYFFIATVGRKVSAFWVLGLTVGHLSALHIYRMITDFGGWQLDASTIYMMSICKFSGLAFSYEDGEKPEKDIRNKYHREKRIVERPTLLETFSYIYYFPSGIMGPSFEFADFRKYINLEDEYQEIPKILAMKKGLLELLKGFTCMGLLIALGGPFDFMYCASDDFGKKNFFYKFFYFNISMFICRTKYYSAWKLSQCNIDFCGLTYHPKFVTKPDSDQKEVEHRFDKVETCVIHTVELDISPKVKITYWNRTVHLWLKYNLFLRLINVEKKMFKDNAAIASLVTFMVSAFWHGFYPVYYLFFFQFYLVEQISGYLEALGFFKYIEKQSKFVYYAVGIITMSFPNYLGITFVLLTFRNVFDFLCNIYFTMPIFIAVLYFYTQNLLIAQIRREKKQKAEQQSQTPGATPGSTPGETPKDK
jgi:lysophospholipid acyltransferase